MALLALLHFSLQILDMLEMLLVLIFLFGWMVLEDDILELLRLVFKKFHETSSVAIMSNISIISTFVIAQLLHRHDSIRTTIAVASPLHHLWTYSQHNNGHLFGLSFLLLARAIFTRAILFTWYRLTIALANSSNVHVIMCRIVFVWLYWLLIGLQLLIKFSSLLFHWLNGIRYVIYRLQQELSVVNMRANTANSTLFGILGLQLGYRCHINVRIGNQLIIILQLSRCWLHLHTSTNWLIYYRILNHFLCIFGIYLQLCYLVFFILATCLLMPMDARIWIIW